MKMCAAEGAQRDSLCYGCAQRRLGCRKECTRGAEEEIMNILLAGELERTRAELKRVTAERDLLAWGIREGNRRKAEELEKRMEEKARRKNRWKRVAALFVTREEN